MADVLDTDAVGILAQKAIEDGLSFSMNIHGVPSLEEAIRMAEDLLGGESVAHDKVRIAQQPSCFVVSAKAGKCDVALFVSKIPRS